MERLARIASILIAISAIFSVLVYAEGSSGANSGGGDSSAPVVSVVPRLIKFSGTLKGEDGSAMSGAVGVTFSLYKG